MTGQSPSIRSQPSEAGAKGVEARIIHRGHGRELDVVVVGVPGESRGWGAGRGRRDPNMIKEKENSPKLERSRGTTPAMSFCSSPESARSHRTPVGKSSTPPLSTSYGHFTRKGKDANGIKDLLSMPLEEVLEIYPLFMTAMGKQSTKTQMNLTLDWAKSEKPSRLLSTVQNCWSQGVFKVVKIKQTGSSSPKPEPKKETAKPFSRVFDPKAQVFTPPIKPVARSPMLDPTAQEFVPPSVLNKRLAKKKKTLDPRASEWTPTPPSQPSPSCLSATASEWTPPCFHVRPPPCFSSSGFEPLPAGPATFASSPVQQEEGLASGDSFMLYDDYGN